MGTVEFHHGVGDKLAYACRLLRKAYRSGAKVVVTGDADTLHALDRQLWDFAEDDFVPHVLAAPGQALSPRLHETPVWLSTDPGTAPGERGVLVNLGQVVPEQMARFPRMFDIVSTPEEERMAGRRRWKAYLAMGWDVQPHEVDK